MRNVVGHVGRSIVLKAIDVLSHQWSLTHRSDCAKEPLFSGSFVLQKSLTAFKCTREPGEGSWISP
jgi:hypothetical protein